MPRHARAFFANMNTVTGFRFRLIVLLMFNSILYLALPSSRPDWTTTFELLAVAILLNAFLLLVLHIVEDFGILDANPRLYHPSHDLEQGVLLKKTY
jgi:hypothetical protein